MPLIVDVIEEPRRAQVLMHPVRLKLLEQLAEPASAATLARRIGLPRQKANYHLRELEGQRLIELEEEKRKGNVTERIYRRTGLSYAISSSTLGDLGANPSNIGDKLSSAYQIALAARAIEELGVLQKGAASAKKKLPTFSLDVDVRFATAEQRDDFAEELAATVADLVRKYHDEMAPRGRKFRFYLGMYPQPKRTQR